MRKEVKVPPPVAEKHHKGGAPSRVEMSERVGQPPGAIPRSLEPIGHRSPARARTRVDSQACLRAISPTWRDQASRLPIPCRRLPKLCSRESYRSRSVQESFSFPAPDSRVADTATDKKTPEPCARFRDRKSTRL